MLLRSSVALSVAVLVSGCTAGSVAPVVPPDLTPVVQRLTAADPAVQQQALVPAVRDPAGSTPVLPPGSQLSIEPQTWAVTGSDAAGGAVAGTVHARLVRPGGQQGEVLLSVALVDGQWLLFDTAAA